MHTAKLMITSFLVVAIVLSQATAGEKEVPTKASFGNPVWHTYALYRVYNKKDSNGVVTEQGILKNDGTETVLKSFQTYNVDGKKKLALYSKLGFSFGNIPLDGDHACYFYNEAIATFLEAEEMLPLGQQWLKRNGHTIRSLEGFQISWPTAPQIHKERGYTFFKVKPITSSCNGTQTTIDTVLGFWDGNVATVTSGYQEERIVVVHEYFHACGHQHGLCKGEDWTVFKDGDKRTTYK